jgi:polyphenol oxidase
LRIVHEVLDASAVPLWRQEEWQARFPWLEQGTTGAAAGDLGLFGQQPVGRVLDRWRTLASATGMRTILHARQVHGVEVGVWTEALPPGLVLAEGIDAHATPNADVLLAVSIADCVPIFLVAEAPRVVGVVHAGWRGTAEGILERAVGVLELMGAAAPDLWLHCGPAICGRCYEVGPEVHLGVNPEQPVPAEPTPIDLAQALCRRARRLGITPERMTVSGHCTLCGAGGFFSHRGGSSGRQVAVLGYRA